MELEQSLELSKHWRLDPTIEFLNHGSFGACPNPVLMAQHELRFRMERQPVQFFVRDLEGLLDGARAELGEFLGADPQDLAWVPNATAGVNAVLRSLSLERGDELLTTNHEYNACRNALEFVAQRAGARIVVAEIPFPGVSRDDVFDAIVERITPHTRLALIDHVTSQTGLILPLARLLSAFEERTIPVLVDGAHAPGMLPVDIAALNPAYYTGNCHKWLCAPKGAGFLYVRRDLQDEVRPAVISHGANSSRTDRSRFLIEFDWTGTIDPSAILCVPDAIRFMGGLLRGGWQELRRHNHDLAVAGRKVIYKRLHLNKPCPNEMIGALASLPLSPGSGVPPTSPLYADPLQDELLNQHGIEVPVIPWPAPPARLLRISAQVYNHIGQYEKLADVLAAL